MAEKSGIKDYICRANISIGGKKYFRDQFYSKSEVDAVPKEKRFKFIPIEAISPEKIDGTNEELKALIQRQQIKIQTLEAALARYEGVSETPKSEEKISAKGKPILSSTGGQGKAEKL